MPPKAQRNLKSKTGESQRNQTQTNEQDVRYCDHPHCLDENIPCLIFDDMLKMYLCEKHANVQKSELDALRAGGNVQVETPTCININVNTKFITKY